MMVRNFVLPPALQRALTSGVWTERGTNCFVGWQDRRHVELFRKVFTRVKSPYPAFDSYDGMLSGNTFWDNPDKLYFGAPHDSYKPGFIDPTKTLFIGGTDHDGPIALDYRTNPPSVIYFCVHGNEAYWHLAAHSIEELLERLEMEV